MKFQHTVFGYVFSQTPRLNPHAPNFRHKKSTIKEALFNGAAMQETLHSTTNLLGYSFLDRLFFGRLAHVFHVKQTTH